MLLYQVDMVLTQRKKGRSGTASCVFRLLVSQPNFRLIEEKTTSRKQVDLFSCTSSSLLANPYIPETDSVEFKSE